MSLIENFINMDIRKKYFINMDIRKKYFLKK